MSEHGGRLPALAGIFGCGVLAAVVSAILLFELRSDSLEVEEAAPRSETSSDKSAASSNEKDERPPAAGDATPIDSESADSDDAPLVPPEAEDSVAAVANTTVPLHGNQSEDAPPWGVVLNDSNEPPLFSEICFDDFDPAKFIPQPRELEQWFDRVPDRSGSISQARSRLGQCGAIDGVLRLKSPWREDTALRLSLENYNRLRIHFFYGRQGVTLVYYESDQYRWAAYTTTRQDGGTVPESLALTATDDGRSRRTEIRFGGPFEIRYRTNELVLSRGDIVLLRAPLDGLPQDVYFEGKSYFHGIALVRDREFPATPEQAPPTMEHDNPAELKWETKLSETASFSKEVDGSVVLSADNAGQRGWVVTEMPRGGIYEAILQIDQATPGTSVFLRCADGNAHEFVRFVENRRDQSLCLTRRGGDDEWSADLGKFDERLVAHAAPQMWIRLLYGCGSLRWWISVNGTHWAETHDYPAQTAGNISHVGIHHVARRGGCQIKLARLSFRRLDRLHALVDEATLERARTIANEHLIDPWLVRANEDVPEDIERSAWQLACTLRTLGVGCPRQLGFDLVKRLLDDAMSSAMAAEDRLDLLDEVSRLMSIREDHHWLMWLIGRYHEVGKDVYQRHQQLPYSTVRKRLLELPLCERINLQVASPELIRIELLELVYASRWQETAEFCRRLEFFQQHQQVPLEKWAAALAQQELPREFSGEQVTRRRDEWRHPYEEELSKRAYNVLAELNALLDGEAYEDAARMIAAIDPTSVSGVAPLANDPKLLVSLPAAIRMAVSEHSPLRQVLIDEFGPLAELRVQQSIAAMDVDGVRLAAIQFGSTPAAAEAHLWLGDRALSGGWFAQAVAEYQRAGRLAGPTQQGKLAPRIRLASAILGREVGEPVTADVSIGQLQVPAAEFEAMIQDMRGRESDAGPALGSPDLFQMPDTLPMPNGLKAHTRSRLDGAVGQDPNAETLGHVRRYQVPWVGRQIATVIDKDLLYASNRFQVAVYDLNNGQRKWQSQNPPAKMLRSQEWSLTPMQPLLIGDRIYARLLYDKGPKLVCLKKQSGELLWSAEQRNNEFLITDPLVVQSQLCCLSLDRSGNHRQTVRLDVIARDSGELMRQEDLLQVRSSWWHRRYCSALPLEDSIVASFGGLTACFDLNGDSRWIRKQLNVPTDEEPKWVQQYFDPPRLSNGRLYIAEPSVRAIECVDPRTGRLHWSTTLPDIRRVVLLDEQRLVIEVEDGLLALSPDDGRILWRKQMDGLLHGVLAARDGTILITQRSPIADRSNQFVPKLTWIEAASGETVGQTSVDSIGESSDPRVGPLLEHQGRLWVFFGRNHDDPNRDFVELAPN